MTQPTLELKFPIIKEAWLDFATLFDASDVFTNLWACWICCTVSIRIPKPPRRSWTSVDATRGAQEVSRGKTKLLAWFVWFLLSMSMSWTCELVESAVGSSCICNEGLKKSNAASWASREVTNQAYQIHLVHVCLFEHLCRVKCPPFQTQTVAYFTCHLKHSTIARTGSVPGGSWTRGGGEGGGGAPPYTWSFHVIHDSRGCEPLTC